MDTDLPFPSNHELDEEDEDDTHFLQECGEEEDKHEECKYSDEKCWTCYEAAELAHLDLQEATATGN